MDIYKRTIVICLLIITVSCLFIVKERFINGKSLSSTPVDIGINATIPNSSNMYFSEISIEEMNKLLTNIIDDRLKLSYKDTTTHPWDNAFPQDIEKFSSLYVLNAINSFISKFERKFTVRKAVVETLKAKDDLMFCTIMMVIHRESKQYGFTVRASIVLKGSDIQGVLDAKALGYVSEDKLILEGRYENVVEYDNAFNIEHTIMKSQSIENSILQRQADALFKDRGIKSTKV